TLPLSSPPYVHLVGGCRPGGFSHWRHQKRLRERGGVDDRADDGDRAAAFAARGRGGAAVALAALDRGGFDRDLAVSGSVFALDHRPAKRGDGAGDRDRDAAAEVVRVEEEPGGGADQYRDRRRVGLPRLSELVSGVAGPACAAGVSAVAGQEHGGGGVRG